jgi:hypothetical protein
LVNITIPPLNALKIGLPPSIGGKLKVQADRSLSGWPSEALLR